MRHLINQLYRPYREENDGKGNGTPPPENKDGKTDEPTLADLKAQLELERKERQEANREAQTFRQKVRDLEAGAANQKASEQSELQKLQTEQATLRQEVEQAKYENLLGRVQVAAAQAGFANPEDAVAFLDMRTLREDGEAGLVPALTELLKAKPYLGKPKEDASKEKLPLTKKTDPPDSTELAKDQEAQKRATSLFPVLNRLRR